MSRSRSATLLLLTFPLLWGLSFPAGKWAVQDFSPELTSFLRFAIASAALWPFALRGRSAPAAWSRRNLLILGLLGLTGIFAYHVLFYWSLRLTSAGNSALIISSDSLLTIGLAVLFLGERMTWRKAVGIALGFAGVAVIVSDGALTTMLTHGPNTGDLLAFGAAIAWALYGVVSKPVAHLYDPFDLSWATWVVGAVLLSPFLLQESALPSLLGGSLRGWLSVLYMSLISTGLGYFLYLKGIKEIGAAATAKFIFLVPVYVLVLAFLFLGEPVPPFKIGAAAAIIVGLWVAKEPEGHG